MQEEKNPPRLPPRLTWGKFYGRFWSDFRDNVWYALPLLVILMAAWLLLTSLTWAFERGDETAKVDSFGDTLYMGWTTTTTVGPGDLTPVTAAGKAFLAMDALLGVVFFGVVVALVFYSWQRT